MRRRCERTPALPGWRVVLVFLALLLQPFSSHAALTGQDSAEDFFSTVAERLLRQQFPFGITNIPIAPANAYSPAVHRLLQVSANLYDATRSNRLPSVFRPIFSATSNGTTANVCIVGYTNDCSRSTLSAWLAANGDFGIPLVIGARKGFPNFNEYSFRTDLQVTRKLEVVRRTTNVMSMADVTATNQMYVLGISNWFAVECWNAYTSAYAGELTMELTHLATLRMTNQTGQCFASNFTCCK